MNPPKGIKIGDLVEIRWEDVKSNHCTSIEDTIDMTRCYPIVSTVGFLKHVGKGYIILAPEYEGESDKEASVWVFPRRMIMSARKLRGDRAIRF